MRESQKPSNQNTEEGKTIIEAMAKMLEFINNSKYVIFVLASFTVCWMPCILLVILDLGIHQFEDFSKSMETNCGLVSAQNLSLSERNIGISCMEDLMIGYVTHCDVPGDERDVCAAFHIYLHDFLIVCLTRLCMCMVVLGSFVNPFIHGVWYPGFRLAVCDLKKR